jgi:hypothetical protein
MNVLKKILPLIFLTQSCNYFLCSDLSLSTQEKYYLDSINDLYTEYEITEDKCYQKGYFIVIGQDQNQSSLDNIFHEVTKKISVDKMKFYDKKGRFKYVMYSIDDSLNKKRRILKQYPNDF